jgi:hypothetical protein
MVVLLNTLGHTVNRKRVQRPMREMGLAGMAPGPNTSRLSYFPFVCKIQAKLLVPLWSLQQAIGLNAWKNIASCLQDAKACDVNRADWPGVHCE